MTYIILFTNYFICIPLEATSNNAFILQGYWMGFFGNFNMVLGALESFEKGECKGVQVAFNESHCYFDPTKGENWWNYYFEPIYIGDLSNSIYPPHKTIVDWILNTRWHMSKKYANYLIRKYIRIKPEILQEIDEFCGLQNFRDTYMIGVHYRGTDKMDKRYAEAEFFSHNQMLACMDLVKLKHPHARFFVATDEETFLEAAVKKYGRDITYVEQIRSTTQLAPHNMVEIPNYIKGKDALIDCLLLSRCNILIRTSSNLSCASVFFNPNIELINVNYPDNVLWKKN